MKLSEPTETKMRPAANKQQDAATSMAIISGDQLLTRRQIRDEFGWSEKTLQRLEDDPANKLVPVFWRKNGGRTKRYYRSHIEALAAKNYREECAVREQEHAATTNGVMI